MNINDIIENSNNLDKEDFFYCEREKCVMRKSLCVKYQGFSKKGFRTGLDSIVYRDSCSECEQGEEIKKELKQKRRTKNEKQKKSY